MITQQRGPLTARRIIAELPFIPAASNWLKLLLSLLAEPFMFVSSLCIIAETVIPSLATWLPWVGPTATTVMSVGPEIILPGCFQQAQRARRDGDGSKARLLYGLCSLFGFLTLITLASFVWNFEAIVGSLTLFVRCAAGIAYTIVLNAAEDGSEAQQQATPPAQPVNAQPAPSHEEIAQLVRSEVQAIAQSLRNEVATHVQVLVQNAQPISAPPAQVRVHEEPAQIAQPYYAPAGQSQRAQLDIIEQTEPLLLAVDALPANDVQQRIFCYLDEFSVDGHVVTLAEIEAVCKVAKNTATRYRRLWREAREAMVQQ